MAGKQAKAVSSAMALAMKELYEKRDSRGKRIWSIMRLANEYEVGETTVYRAINSLGSYKDVPEPLPERDSPEMQRRAAESLARLQKLLAKPEEQQEDKEGTALIVKQFGVDIRMGKEVAERKILLDIGNTAVEELRKPPVNPLDE